ncbi:MAG: hypothetical protein RI953_1832 [Pseudomonadota bacterium]|jgi:hypothetical protein
MDTRLLRLWSNCKCAAFVCLLNFVGIFIASLSFVGSAQGAALAHGQLNWNSERKLLVGEVVYALPRSSENVADETDSFWLLPNRDLVESGNQKGMSREQREFHSGAPDFEWPFSDESLGAILVKGVKTSSSHSSCPSSPQDIAQKMSSLPMQDVTFEFQDNERILLIGDKQYSGRGQTRRGVALCRFVSIKFEFHPRLGVGNFAQFSNGDATFSGPVFPVWKKAPVFTRLNLTNSANNSGVWCNRCAASSDGKASIVFNGLPPPIHFRRSAPLLMFEFRHSVGEVAGSSASAGLEWNDLRGAIEIFRKVASKALANDATSSEQAWQVKLFKDLTIEQLVTEQLGEIQLHGSFGKVTPVLSEYHSAALFRALARSLARHLLTGSENQKLDSWQAFRRNETVARILAEIWLQEAFPRLSFLKNLSDQLSFLPFFRAIQQGSAFVNNAVFVGGEEGASRIDYSALNDFLAPFRGAELLGRINACAKEELQSQIRTQAMAVLNAEKTASEFAIFLSSAKTNESCIVPMDTGLVPAWVVEEKIEVKEGEGKRLKLSRALVRPSSTTDFFFSTDGRLARDSLRLSAVTRTAEKVLEVHNPDSADNSSKQLDSQIESVKVMSPNRAISGERLQWPRPIRTVIQAFALNYDSRRSDITLRSQFQTFQTGDEWNRSLLLGWRREFEKNYLDLSVSTNIPSIFKESRTSISLASTTQLVQAPPSFLSASYSVDKGTGSLLYPDGLGLKIWLRRPLTLTALKESMPQPEQEWTFSAALPLAPRLTWSESFNYGLSEKPIDVGLRSVPGWPSKSFMSNEYLVMRSEIRNTLAQNLNASVASSILFQHAVFYAAHVVAFDDLQAARRGTVDTRTSQSLFAGVRLFGALFGAKDQALGFEVARALADPARTSFGLTIGKTVN